MNSIFFKIPEKIKTKKSEVNTIPGCIINMIIQFFQTE